MKLSGPNGVTMLIIMQDLDVRFTTSGVRMAVVYTNLYPHMRFECWDDTIIESLIDIKWPQQDWKEIKESDGREETLLEVTGKLEIKSYKTAETVTRQNNFTIKDWKLG